MLEEIPASAAIAYDDITSELKGVSISSISIQPLGGYAP